jgi:hypothetical protein
MLLLFKCREEAACPRMIYLPTKHTKGRENLKDEDPLVRVPSVRGGTRCPQRVAHSPRMIA